MSAAENRAVFLSYASQDAEAARRICEALRASGVEVWFDQNELVGGDAWDAKIRGQIAACTLFVPIVSANTNARGEGYFRLEWKLAVDRSHLMAHDQAFLLPVVIDETADAAARVPPEFRSVQWTRLPRGETPEKFCARVKALMEENVDGDLRAPSVAVARTNAPGGRVSPRNRRGRKVGIVLALAAVALVALALWRPWEKSAGRPPPTAAAPITEAQQLVAKARRILDDGDEMNHEVYFLAEDLVKRAVALDPAEPQAWAFYARLSHAMVWHSIDLSDARRDMMRRQAERALTLAPDSTEAQIAGADARIYLQQDLAGVERQLLALAAREPTNWRVQRSLGTLYRAFNRLDDAVQALQRARDLSAGLPMASADLANALLRGSRHAEAEAVLSHALARSTSGRLLTFDLYTRMLWRADLEGARQALAAWPDWLLLESRGAVLAWQCWLMSRHYDKALAVAQRLPRDYLHDTFFTGPRAVLTARAHEAAGNAEAARADWRTVVQLADRELAGSSTEIAAWYWKAWALARLGDLAEAQAIGRQMQQRNQLSLDLSRARNNHATARYLGGPGAGPFWTVVGMPELALAELAVPLAPDIFVPTCALLELDPVFDPLRADPRFAEIVAKAPAPERKAADVSMAAPHPNSVAVLPFANQSADKDNEYFSDGVADELLTVLKKIPGLRVMARTSAFSFKDKKATIPEIGRALNVAHVVEGSVQKMGDQVKISASLSRSDTGEQEWSEVFTRDLSNVFAVQSELAQTIVGQLRGQLGAADRAEIATQVRTAQKGGTKNPQALQLYLQGMFHYARGSSADVAQSITCYEQAIAADSAFAAAWAAVARARVWQGCFEPLVTERFRQARVAAEQALTLEPNLAEAHSVMSQVLQRHYFDWTKARAASERALQLAPEDAEVLTDACTVGQSFGDWEHSIAAGRRAVSLDPVNPEPHLFLAISYLHSGGLPEAETEIRRACELARTGVFLRLIACQILLEAGRPQEALAEARKETGRMHLLEALALAEFACGRRAESDAALKALETEFANSCPFQIAEVYAARNEPALAFKWLERAWEVRDPGTGWVRVAVTLKNLHHDPRWPAFLKKVGLHDEQLK